MVHDNQTHLAIEIEADDMIEESDEEENGEKKEMGVRSRQK